MLPQAETFTQSVRVWALPFFFHVSFMATEKRVTVFPFSSLVVTASAPRLPSICAKFLMGCISFGPLMGHTARRYNETANSQERLGSPGACQTEKFLERGPGACEGGGVQNPEGATASFLCRPQGESAFSLLVPIRGQRRSTLT